MVSKQSFTLTDETETSITRPAEVTVSGCKFEIRLQSLKENPETLLGKMVDAFVKEKIETPTFDRPVEHFKAIHAFYQTGKLHMPLHVCPMQFSHELQYWGFQCEQLEPCCRHRYLSFMDNFEINKRFRQNLETKTFATTSVNGQRSMKNRIWTIIDNREKSVPAKIYLSFILLFVLLSLISLSLSTLPQFNLPLTVCELRAALTLQETSDDILEFLRQPGINCNSDPKEQLRLFLGKHYHWSNERFDAHISKLSNLTNSTYSDGSTTSGSISTTPIDGTSTTPTDDNSTSHYSEEYIEVYTEEDIEKLKFKKRLKNIPFPNKLKKDEIFHMIDLVVMIVFSLDLILRLTTCPSVIIYYRSMLNVTDTLVLFIAISGFLANHFMIEYKYENDDLEILIYLQVLRVFRLLRVVQHVAAIQVLVFCFKSNFKEILILILFLFVGVNFFANALYFVEERESIESIPKAWWWGIITMTTVGYGDVYPKSVTGRIIGTLCAVAGVIVLALIIPIFVNNFINLYEHAKLFYNMKTINTRLHNQTEATNGANSPKQNKVNPFCHRDLK